MGCNNGIWTRHLFVSTYIITMERQYGFNPTVLRTQVCMYPPRTCTVYPHTKMGAHTGSPSHACSARGQGVAWTVPCLPRLLPGF
jgi:hypothetical protein